MSGVSLVVQPALKNLPAMQETWVWSLSLEDPQEEGVATHSSPLAWRVHGPRSLAGGSPRGWAELDVTEWLSSRCSSELWMAQRRLPRGEPGLHPLAAQHNQSQLASKALLRPSRMVLWVFLVLTLAPPFASPELLSLITQMSSLGGMSQVQQTTICGPKPSHGMFLYW